MERLLLAGPLSESRVSLSLIADSQKGGVVTTTWVSEAMNQGELSGLNYVQNWFWQPFATVAADLSPPVFIRGIFMLNIQS